jgi:glycosyltransferase involved in cell wall biosynthesis
MRVAIYADPAFASSAGIEQVSRHVIAQCIKKYDKVGIITGSDFRERAVQTFGTHSNVEYITLKLDRRSLYLTWGLLGLPRLDGILSGYDVLLATSHIYLPSRRVPKLAILHDLVILHHPEDFTLFERIIKPFIVKKFVRTCDHLISDSKFTKEDAVSLLSVPRSKISVAYLGYNNELYNTLPSDPAYVRTMGITGPYVLYVGSLYPRRYTRLVEGFSIMKQEWHRPEKLVIVGAREHKKRGVPTLAEKISVLHCKDDVILAENVADEEVSILMKNASVFIYPSAFEGFGIPPLEAMACGVPVIVGKNSSLPELYGDSAYMINDVYEEREIARALNTVLSDKQLQARMRADSLRNASKFSWENYGARVFTQIDALGEKTSKNAVI